ncbi:MAG: flagellar hook-associated protein FlgL [Armatimonadetes bacterium]|nr:flagellar hook-associated protein FlgL [Armatimonadota bacterium]
MRISTSQIYENSQRTVQGNYAEYMRWQSRVASGKKVEKLSDEPGQATTLLRLRSLKSHIEQYSKNLTVANDYLKNSERVLTEVSELAQKGYQLAIQGATSTMDQNSRQAIAGQVAQMQDRLLAIANEKGNSGQFLFAGQKTETQPFTVASNALVYNGDTNKVLVETAPGKTLQVNTAASQTVVNLYAQLESLKSNLTGGHIGNLSGIDVPALESLRQEVTQARSEAGNRLYVVTNQKADNDRRSDDLMEGISGIEDVDLAEAVSELKRAETAYQASLQVAAGTLQLSLLDYLR